jgi:CheY-like chemotaxis protein
VAAACPGEALRLLDAGAEVDLLLSDVVMPEMSGYELAARVRADRPHVPVLFISGYRSETAGAPPDSAEGQLLQKPFTPDELTQALQHALARGARAA